MWWLWAIVVSVGPAVVAIYLLGCWLMGVWPWDMWHEAVPDMYDGKEPYERWAEKMEMARRLQQQEERKSD